MKHLNPRQGITTVIRVRIHIAQRIECETPKSPPGDYNAAVRLLPRRIRTPRVKHLNPRQGITTGRSSGGGGRRGGRARVKHLNPRQGITTLAQPVRSHTSNDIVGCETPKSPPGDYNREPGLRSLRDCVTGVKHLNPRQGITTLRRRDDGFVWHAASVKHLNPRQGITTLYAATIPRSRRPSRVKHLNPRQGITTTRCSSLPASATPIASVKHLNPRQGITSLLQPS